MIEQKNFNKMLSLRDKLGKLAPGEVVEAKDLTKEEASFFMNIYKKEYLVRGPIKEQKNKYVLFFELNYRQIKNA